MSLAEQLDALHEPLLQRLSKRGFDKRQLLAWAESMGGDTKARNLLPGELRPAAEAELHRPPLDKAERERLRALGQEALANGQLAVCVLAGGMATRMRGVVKALVEVAAGVSFLELRVAELAQLGAHCGQAPPLWLMTSEPTDGPIRAALGERCDGEHIATFEQFVSLRLCTDRELFVDEAGQPSVYATGHGDLPEALQRSGLLDGFNARGGRYVWISNLDNLGASVDPVLLGQHIASEAALSVELVDKWAGDKGGGPVMHDGRPIIAELFRLPEDFDHEAMPVFNTNTFLAGSVELAQLELPWTYLEVHKRVGDHTAVQFERLIGEMTMALAPNFLRVPRQGPESRFLPVKTPADLETHRAAIEQIVAARGHTPSA